ncbi:phosphotransferase [Pelagicoccus sp. SDUM812003]|uniref:phosphotransferase n=1 Tax=Pelagicoccus sp. SDUM812003 TaxID=3041267 RepID=UPI00280D5764|nr:phosphotransferase [Pelagicoccus sp. SDUM812003]MDQ8203117.1 phosphotransferase [Pelagicoccus sp. SDUM812003]
MSGDPPHDTLCQKFMDTLIRSTGARAAHEIETLQTLWSGYGKIARYALEDCELDSVIVKRIKLPTRTLHPRGWNTDRSHQRKVRSYEVETAWYRNANNRCDASCRTPKCYAVDSHGEETLIVLEDLDAAGFTERRQQASPEARDACIDWLASFHARFMGMKPEGLWPKGTYWHLDTRPDELEALEDIELKRAAAKIDALLSSSPFQTIVHGDAKIANFCFSADERCVAAVDFQYVGGGCGMKDLAYFIGSCLSESECERLEEQLLGRYFSVLRSALSRQQSEVNADELEANWRALFPFAWTDFHRFLKGWSPGHWKLNTYSERLARAALKKLNK